MRELSLFNGAAAAILLLGLPGCGATRAVVNEPSQITLDRALKETVDALYAARAHADKIAADGPRIGLNACSVQAVFNITAGATANQGLVLNVGAPAGAPVVAGVQGTVGQTETVGRGNTVTVLFTTPACNPTGTLGSAEPENVALLQRQIALAREGLYPPADGRERRPRRPHPEFRAIKPSPDIRPTRPEPQIF